MPLRIVATYPVTATGIGRADYSQNIEQSVEPITRSWQEDYSVWAEPGDIVALGTLTYVIEIPGETVVIPYDFYLTNYNNVLLQMEIDALLADGTWAPIAYNQDLRTVEIHLTKGFPLFRKWRIIYTNADTIPPTGTPTLDIVFTAHGIYTSEKTYYGMGRSP